MSQYRDTPAMLHTAEEIRKLDPIVAMDPDFFPPDPMTGVPETCSSHRIPIRL